MTTQHPNDPLHGITLEMMLNQLVDHYGWEEMGRRIRIRCLTVNPSIKSSLSFLRKTPWARAKVEALYRHYLKQVPDRRGVGDSGGKRKAEIEAHHGGLTMEPLAKPRVSGVASAGAADTPLAPGGVPRAVRPPAPEDGDAVPPPQPSGRHPLAATAIVSEASTMASASLPPPNRGIHPQSVGRAVTGGFARGSLGNRPARGIVWGAVAGAVRRPRRNRIPHSEEDTP